MEHRLYYLKPFSEAFFSERTKPFSYISDSDDQTEAETESIMGLKTSTSTSSDRMLTIKENGTSCTGFFAKSLYHHPITGYTAKPLRVANSAAVPFHRSDWTVPRLRACLPICQSLAPSKLVSPSAQPPASPTVRNSTKMASRVWFPLYSRVRMVIS